MAKIKKGKAGKKSAGEALFIAKLNILDVITLSGMLLALTSILHSHYSRLENALAFMFVAMLVDSLDREFAKALKMERLFGRFLDGFIDLLVYIIAPAVFFYYFGFERVHIVWMLLLYGACGVVRLSVYDQVGDIKLDKNKLAYMGMPVYWSHVIAAVFYGLSYIWKGDAVVFTAGAVMLIYAFLMVLNRPFPQIKSKPYMYVILAGLIAFFFWLGATKGQPLF